MTQGMILGCPTTSKLKKKILNKISNHPKLKNKVYNNKKK
jgi:hypothetical protein